MKHPLHLAPFSPQEQNVFVLVKKRITHQLHAGSGHTAGAYQRPRIRAYDTIPLPSLSMPPRVARFLTSSSRA